MVYRDPGEPIYYAIQGGESPELIVSRRGILNGAEFYDSVTMSMAPDPIWVETQILDLGSAVWENGVLVNPE